ncbi:MAG: D-3-phosphoglycerate dehydrogenase / 2-oxoglutarate reductase [Chloroflexota bacterium]|nr:D-3-phosphoglycerate dehydrogenase / 2-oxoglutarate reductase [Chloroflexota bacterium]
MAPAAASSARAASKRWRIELPQFYVLYTDRSDYSDDMSRVKPIYDAIDAIIVDARLDHNNLDRAAYARHLAIADAIITHRVPVDEPAVAAAPKLRIAVRGGVGYENLDLTALTERGIPGCNVPDYGSEEVAVHALSQLLALRRQLLFYDSSLRTGRWQDWEQARTIHRLSLQTAGIVGFGRIGREFAARARAFFGEVIACDPYIAPEEITARGVRPVSIDELLASADAVTLHVPLSPETTHLIGEPQLRRMKRNAVLVNTSRGPVVDQLALAQALEHEWIEGAACDVWEREPPDPAHPLLRCPNFVASPHVAYYSEEGDRDLRRLAAEEVARVLRGEPPRCRLN